MVAHDIAYAGRESADKRRDLAAALGEAGRDAAVLTLPDSIAWLLNVRGGDVTHTPLPLSFALLDREGRVELFVDPAKPAPGLGGHLGNEVSLAPPEAFGPALDGLAGKKVLVDADRAPAWVVSRLEAAGAEIVRERDPCILPKACKNEGEIAGTRAAHRRDAGAMADFLAWLDREGPSGRQTELSAAARLRSCRERLPLFRDLSFPTISGAGPNGAVVHYGVTEATDRAIAPDMLYLVDSGAQFLGRHDGHHPHHRHRQPDRAPARLLHPRPERAYRARHGPVSGRHYRRPARHAGARAALAGRPRFRPRHRPRRRQLPLGA